MTVKSSIHDCFPTLPDVTDDDESDLLAQKIQDDFCKSSEPINLLEVTHWMECDRAIE